MRPAVIIPCLNEADYVGRLEQDLASQTVQPAEVLVVDSGSSDGTKEAAERSATGLPLRVVEAPERGLALARNLGATTARAQWLLFLDADMRVAPDLIERLEARAQKTGADVVSPRFKQEGRHPVDTAYALSENIRIRYITMGLLGRPAGLGGSTYIQKAIHNAIGGFDEQKHEFEDWDYFKRLGAHGVKFAFAADAVATLSSRRFAAQGRFRTLAQTIPDDTFVGRRITRPLMKKIGLPPKW